MSGHGVVPSVPRALLWSALNSASLRVGNVLVGVVIARLLVPEEFGLYAVGLVAWSLLGSVAELGLGADLVRCADPERRRTTVATVALGTGSLLGLAMWGSATPLASALGNREAAPVLQLMSVTMVLIGLSVVPSAMLQRRFQQSRLFAADAAALLVSTVVVIVLARQGMGAMALAWSRIAGQSTSTVMQFVLADVRPRFAWRWPLAKESIRFGAPLAAANLLSWLVLSVDNIVVAHRAGVVALGLYVLAFNISSWPISAVGQTIRVVALPAFSRGADEQRRQLLTSAVACAWAAALGIGLLLVVLAHPLVHLVYGARWLPAAAALTGLGFFGACRVVLDLMATYLIASGRSGSVMAAQVAALVGMTPAMYAAVGAWGLAGAGWAHVGVAVLMVLPCYLWLLRRTGVVLRPLLRCLLPPLVAALPAALLGSVVVRWSGDTWSGFVLGGSVLVVVYTLPMGRWLLGHFAHVRSHDTSSGAAVVRGPVDLDVDVVGPARAGGAS